MRTLLPIAALLVSSAAFAANTETPRVITLNQVGCQFLESEGDVNHGYRPKSAADCERINKASGEKRVGEAKVLELPAGKYVFRVTNRDVPYELGFWLRGASLAGRALLPSVSGGGLTTGVTQDYEIALKPGEYVYSCPLNPTPDYKLVVR
ncbi:hypothetical protein [Cognatazoarcus halotolerans]|uniref:hypothetical protein n=1 Tax=Cognatazoarcus halotolerans TaxID=2686016 RepID=UPI0013583646|nr:hypothetical protein [Cognatazoarcus halotolerans]MBX3679163.1 hypothetical protein [Rhodocyclaceae bacterium]MCB1899523.1 hypothetical protein [Rhodocyclaceae bacterium]MCP5311029.1 hypothetical protein [Zoogloeaceae bacterium]